MPKRKCKPSEGLSAEEIACLTACAEMERISAIMQPIIDDAQNDLFVQALQALKANPAKQLEYIALAVTYEFSQEASKAKRQKLVSAALNDEQIIGCFAIYKNAQTESDADTEEKAEVDSDNFNSIIIYIVENLQTELFIKVLIALKDKPDAQVLCIISACASLEDATFAVDDLLDEVFDKVDIMQSFLNCKYKEAIYDVVDYIHTASKIELLIKFLKALASAPDKQLELIEASIFKDTLPKNYVQEITLKVLLEDSLLLFEEKSEKLQEILSRIDLGFLCEIIDRDDYKKIDKLKNGFFKNILHARIIAFNHLYFSGVMGEGGYIEDSIRFLEEFLPDEHSFREEVKEKILYKVNGKNKPSKDNNTKFIFFSSVHPEHFVHHINGVVIHNNLLCFCNRGLLNLDEDDFAGLKFYKINEGCIDALVEKLNEVSSKTESELYKMLSELKKHNIISAKPIYVLEQKEQARGNCTVTTIKSTMLALHLFSKDTTLCAQNIKIWLTDNVSSHALTTHLQWYKKLTFNIRLKAFNEFLSKHLKILITDNPKGENLWKNANVCYMFAIKIKNFLQKKGKISAEVITQTLENISKALEMLKKACDMPEEFVMKIPHQIVHNLEQTKLILEQNASSVEPLAFDFAQLCISQKLGLIFKDGDYIFDFMYSVTNYRECFIGFINSNKNKNLATVLTGIFEHLNELDCSSVKTQGYLEGLFIVLAQMDLQSEAKDETLINKTHRDEYLKKLLLKMQPDLIFRLNHEFNKTSNTDILAIINFVYEYRKVKP